MLLLVLKIIVVIVAFFILIMIIDGNRFVIREYTIESSKASKSFDFILLADLHNKQYGRDNKKLINSINRMNPQAVICAGDMLTAKPGCQYDVSLQLLSKLAERYPVYAGIGNHEYRMKLYTQTYGEDYSSYTEKLQNAGVRILENNSVFLKEYNLIIQGVMIERSYYKRFHTTKMNRQYMQTIIGNPDRDKMQIFVAHNPDYFKEYVEAGADLVLSGHIHGGIMRLPIFGGVVSPKCTLFPKYDGGIFKEKDASMVLSRGLGTHTIPIRIFNPGELILVHVTSCK